MRERQFEYKVTAAAKRRLGAGIFIEYRRLAALRKASAHNGDYAAVGAEISLHCFNLVFMPKMEWVIFTYDGGGFHNFL